MFLQSCRELKKYISEGRKIIREIEEDTLENNPALFREYVTAPQDVRIIMDNQFRNMKTHARLQSKAMWYQWRMQINDGLKKGLVRHVEDLTADKEIIESQETLLEQVVPSLTQQFTDMDTECRSLRQQVAELDECNQEELKNARDSLAGADAEVERKRGLIEELREQLHQRESGIETIVKQKERCLEQIHEAAKVQEECRGWNVTEVRTCKDRVTSLQTQTGWTITSASNTDGIVMLYKNELEVKFTSSSFLQKNGVAPLEQENQKPIAIRVMDCPVGQATKSSEATKAVFLDTMLKRFEMSDTSKISVRTFLYALAKGWDLALSTCAEIANAELTYPLAASASSDRTSIEVSASMLVQQLTTNLNITFTISPTLSENFEWDVTTLIRAKVLYGEKLDEAKMGDFLKEKTDGCIMDMDDKEGTTCFWGNALRDLEGRLVARGRK